MSLPHCHSEVQTVNNPFTDLFLAFIIAGGISIILLHTLGEVKTHRFCVCDPKATHTIAFIALPNALHSGTNGVNQILVGDADRGLLLTLRLGELVAPLLIMEMSRNVQSGNTQNLKSMVIQRSFPKWSVAERRKTAAASNQAACCACTHSRYLAGGSPSGLRV